MINREVDESTISYLALQVLWDKYLSPREIDLHVLKKGSSLPNIQLKANHFKFKLYDASYFALAVVFPKALVLSIQGGSSRS